MENKEIYKKTRLLLEQLNYFIGHVLAYFVINVITIFLGYKHVESLWWVILPGLWTLFLLYHAMHIYEPLFLREKNKNEAYSQKKATHL